MMKKIFYVLLVSIVGTGCFAQETIQLPVPQKEGGKPLMSALNDRRSSRNFTAKDLTDQQLSNLLWAAWGINRTKENKHTAPSSRNTQEMDVYITTSRGAFRYDPVGNMLIRITSDDVRSSTGAQDFVKVAALNLVYVMDKKRTTPTKNEMDRMVAASICTGAIVQNVYLWCASEDLGCVVRAMFDKDLLAKTLKLSEDQVIIVTQTVGYLQ